MKSSYSICTVIQYTCNIKTQKNMEEKIYNWLFSFFLSFFPEHTNGGEAYSRMAVSSSSLPCNGRVPNIHLYENPRPDQDRDLVGGHLCGSHNHVNSVNVDTNSNNNHALVAPAAVRQSHSIPTAISSRGDVSPGIRAPPSPTTHLTPNGHCHTRHIHSEKLPHRHSRHERRHVKGKTSPVAEQSIPRTCYLPTAKSHPVHTSNRVTSPTIASPTEV